MSKAVLEPTIVKPQDKTVAGNWWEKSVAPPSTSLNVHGKIMQTINFNLGSFDDENRTFKAVASSAVVDRQGDVVDQAGWDLSNFVVNPVVPWAHDYFQPPVARATEIGVVNGVLQFVYQAPPRGMYEFADLIWDFYRNQYMFAFSVGFIPSEQDGNTFTKCELLEISAVVVPANPQALALAYKSGDMDIRHAKLLKDRLEKTLANLSEIIVMSKKLEEDDDTADEIKKGAKDTKDSAQKLKELIKEAVDEAMNNKGETTVVDVEEKGAISSNLPLADKGTSWDSGAAVKAVKDWASNDAGDIDFGKYKKAFMWVSDGAGDKQGDYKLPFATVSDGKLVAVWNAVKAIMAVLNGGRGGVQGVDRDAVYKQVKKYYKKFGEEVPPLKAYDGLENDMEIEERSEKAETAEKKGAVADEIEDEQVFARKQQNIKPVFNVFWAFVDVYFDEDTEVDSFKDLLTETSDLFQKIASGDYKPGGTSDGGGLVIASASKNEGNSEELLHQFFTKLLTGNSPDKDNKLMGKKDMGEGGSAGALTPTQMTQLKAMNDYLVDTKDLLDNHCEALSGHAKTMNSHATLLQRQSKGLDTHIKALGTIMQDTAAPDDGISAPHTSSSGKSSETEEAETKEAKGEVKSEETPTDGADHSDKVADKKVEKDSKEVSKKSEETEDHQQPAEEPKTPTEEPTPAEEPKGDETPAAEEAPTEGKATDPSKTKTEDATAELTDETMVDPDNLSDEEAEEIVRAINDALKTDK